MSCKVWDYYLCKKSRSKKCPCKLKVVLNGNTEVIKNHNDDCRLWHRAPLADVTNYDFTEEMKDHVIKLALDCPDLRPRGIWKREMNKKNKLWRGLTDAQVVSLVKNTRTQELGNDVFRKVEDAK